MFRKLAIALGASAVVVAAALAPTAASAKHWHHGWHHGWHNGFYVGLYPGYVAPDCYIVRKVVWTPYGKRVRRVEVCD
jgi:hypothetical protein